MAAHAHRPPVPTRLDRVDRGVRAYGQMRLLRTAEELRPLAGGVFVPTMGALHAGHLALIDAARRLGTPTIVSIFVNPTQFAPGEDFDRYPRPVDRDLELCRAHGADAVFLPAATAIYPPDLEVPVPPLPAVATGPGLEDRIRPGHFAGVCQVVARLFDLVRPCAAVFGEKDYQQLRVITAMVEAAGDRWPGLRIVGHPTVREPDGLAMSSRNAYLHPDERGRALGLFRALQAAAGADAPGAAEHIMRETLHAHDLAVEYAVVRTADSLLPADSLAVPTRALVAARLGTVRLIDTLPMPVRA